MKILLGYSTSHFTPGKRPEEHLYWGSSANVLARTLFEILCEIGEVTYIDAGDIEKIRGQQFDLFVGAIKNFGRTLDACAIKRSVLFAVNQHPVARNRTLLDFVARAGLPAAAIHGWDLVDEDVMSRDIARADAVFVVGNVTTINSYVEHGVDRRRLRSLNYSTRAPSHPRGHRSPGATRLLFVASEIGLRKGFDLLEHALLNAAQRGADFHLDVAGAPSHRFYERRLDALRARLGDRMTWHGWLEPTSGEYELLLDNADVLLFPSLEEGQAGTVLDALARGVIPLVSHAAGIDFAPLGHLATDPASEANVAILERACALEDRELHRLHLKTLEYMSELHEGFREPLADALRGAARGEVWPKASVVLPIFNKERTVKHLLRLLDRALTAYANVELHIILDGCTDGTERLVREFLAEPHSYPTRVSITPDIFEVKTNNIGLRAATGAYGVIVQDDNLVYDESLLFETITFLEKDRTAAVVGCLAGVNFYPRGTRGLVGAGQITMDERETYWRQDAATDPSLRERIFQVDACMRGPLLLRKSFLEAHGYLDEAYAPLYQDDMDLCLRAADRGFKVYCLLADVENDSGTMGGYSAERWAWLAPIMQRNTDLFYARWTPSLEKNYLTLERTRWASPDGGHRQNLDDLAVRVRRRWVKARREWLHLAFLHPVVRRVRPAIEAGAKRLGRSR